MKIGKPIKYLAVPPEEVVERVKKKVVIEAEESQKMLEELRESPAMKELNQLHTQGIDLVEPSDLAGSVKGRENIYNHMETMIKGAKESINILTTTEGAKRKGKHLQRVLKKAAERGVNIKISTPDKEATMKEFSKIKENIYYTQITKPKTRFCVIDNREAAFFLTNDEETHPSYETCVWVNTPHFSGAISDAFGF